MGLDNDLIKQKIDSISDFPENYNPNLETKWDLLATSMEQQKKQKNVFVLWTRIASAAAIVLVSGIVLLFYTPVQKSIKTVSQQAPNQHPYLKQELTIAKTESKFKAKKRRATKEVTKIEEIDTNTLIEEPTDILVELPPTVEVAKLASKKPERFVEVDFYEPALSPQTSTETIVKATQFKFKIGSLEAKHRLNAQHNQFNSVGLKTTF